MLSKQQKYQLVAEAAEILKTHDNIIFTDFTGLTMPELSALKRELKKQQAGYKVIKKSLFGFVLKGSGKEGIDLSAHRGSLAAAYSGNDGSILAKTINSFAVSTKKLIILGGFLMGQVVDAGQVTALAKLPSREILLSQLVRLLLSPLTRLAKAIDHVSKKIISEF